MSYRPTPEAEAVAQRLPDLGIDASAARTYAHLLTAGTMKASTVAAAAGIGRHAAYRDLAALVGLGLASATMTRPMMYVPADPHEALQMLYHRRTRQAKMVHVEALDLAPLLHEIRSLPDGKTEGPIRIIGGRQRTYEYLHEMLSGSMRRFLVINNHPAAARLAAHQGLWQRVQQRAEVGLQIRILMGRDSGAAHYANSVTSDNCQIRLLETGELIRFAIADQEKMLFFTSIDPSHMEEANDSAFITTAAAFVQMENALFWRLWEEAKRLGE